MTLRGLEGEVRTRARNLAAYHVCIMYQYINLVGISASYYQPRVWQLHRAYSSSSTCIFVCEYVFYVVRINDIIVPVCYCCCRTTLLGIFKIRFGIYFECQTVLTVS